MRAVLEFLAFVLAWFAGVCVLGWAMQWLAGRGPDEPRDR